MGAYSEEPEDPWSAQRWGQPPPPPPPAYPADLPPSMRKAVELMYAGAVLTVVGAVVRLMAADPEREVYGARDPGVTTGPQVLGALFGAAVAVLLWCWMAGANRDGKGWARTTATVFGVIAIAGGAFTLAMAAPTTTLPMVDTVLNLIETALAVVILVLMYQDDSNRFYAEHSLRRW